jgi:zinc transport system substrate-binding protein
VGKKRVIFLVLSLWLSHPAWAITVLSSIKPIQMITHELVLGVGQADVLLENNTSPHDYAMRPSDIKKIQAADLVIWFGFELESFMDKVTQAVDPERLITINKIEPLSLAHFNADHQDDGHNHGTLDPHFWLGKTVTLEVAQAIAHKLSQLDAVNTEHYEANLQRFKHMMNVTNQDISKRLTPLNRYPYYVFHDAYGYFERDYELNNVGNFTVSPDRKPGAKTLIAIKKALLAQPQTCVFSEPQFQPAIINTVVAGTSSKLGTLDPLGTDIEVGDLSYFKLLTQLASEFERCFTEQ